MRVLVVFGLVVVAVARNLQQDLADWSVFKNTYNRTYSGFGEDERQFVCFQKNMATADHLNSIEPDATFGMTKFSDLCEDQWKAMQGFKKGPLSQPRILQPPVPDQQIAKLLAQEVDWRKKGAVAPVEDQGHCGSCWSFSAVDAVVGAAVASGKKLLALSTQELVDCTVATMPKTCPGCFDGEECLQRGCQGGDMYHALMWVQKNHGLAALSDYPYTSGTDPSPKWCQFGKCTNGSHSPISSVKGIAKDEGQILAALQTTPLSISVDASSLQHYKGGIMRSCSSSVPDHGVGLVGYALDGSSKGYWIVKNSWGQSWGESGFFRAEYGSNQCDIKHWVNMAVI